MKIIGKSLAQGDVLLVPIDTIPANVKAFPLDKGRLVLAYGEVTGHAHVVSDPTVGAWVDEKDQVFLDVQNLLEEVRLTHGMIDGRPENPADKPHDPITVPPGKYRVVRNQREFVSTKGVTRVSQD